MIHGTIRTDIYIWCRTNPKPQSLIGRSSKSEHCLNLKHESLCSRQNKQAGQKANFCQWEGFQLMCMKQFSPVQGSKLRFALSDFENWSGLARQSSDLNEALGIGYLRKGFPNSWSKGINPMTENGNDFLPTLQSLPCFCFFLDCRTTFLSPLGTFKWAHLQEEQYMVATMIFICGRISREWKMDCKPKDMLHLDFLLPDLPLLCVQFDRNSDCQILDRIWKQQTMAMQGHKDAPRSGQKESEWWEGRQCTKILWKKVQIRNLLEVCAAQRETAVWCCVI